MLIIGEGIKWERESLKESKSMTLQTVQWCHQEDSYEICEPRLVCEELIEERRAVPPCLPTGTSKETSRMAGDPQHLKAPKISPGSPAFIQVPHIIPESLHSKHNSARPLLLFLPLPSSHLIPNLDLLHSTYRVRLDSPARLRIRPESRWAAAMIHIPVWRASCWQILSWPDGIQTMLCLPSLYSFFTLKTSPVCWSQGNELEENSTAENKQMGLPNLFKDFKHSLTF